MYPHARLLLSALTFSASLGLLVAAAAVVLGMLEASGAFGSRADDSPLHAISFLVFVFAPLLALVSLVVSIPASYLVWKFQSVRFSHVAVVLAVSSFALVGLATLPGSALLSAAIAGATLALAAIAAAYFWALTLPRSNTSLERTHGR
jgi:hypothetical protein